MRIEYIDNKLVVYLKDINNDEHNLLCQLLISKIKKLYNIEIKGFYDVNIFYDINYGTIIEFIPCDLDISINYTKADLNIAFYASNFLYKLDDVFDMSIKYFYLYDENYYININNVNSNNIEFGKIIYKDCDEIRKLSKIIIM